MIVEKERLSTDRSVVMDRVLRSSDGNSTKLIQVTAREGFVTIESGRYEVDDESIVCLSTQIGCAMECQFCKSTEPFEFFPGEPQRILRSLTDQEIVDQAINAIEAVPIPQDSKGIVFSYMGMGEPFANLREVKKSIVILGARYKRARVTISTTGFNLSGIRELADEVASGAYPIPVKLHISLHSSSDDQRKQLIPHASPIVDTLDVYRLGILLKDRQGLILKLAELNNDDRSLVVTVEGADQFENLVKKTGIQTARFVSQGKDIKAGCGELVKGKV